MYGPGPSCERAETEVHVVDSLVLIPDNSMSVSK